MTRTGRESFRFTYFSKKMALTVDESQSNAKTVSIGIVEWNGQFLIGKRPSKATLAGFWEFPGGKVQDGEALCDAVIRECVEETGLYVRVLWEFAHCDYEYDHGAVALHSYLCEPLYANATPREPFVWVPRNELSRYEFPPANRDVLQMLIAGSC